MAPVSSGAVLGIDLGGTQVRVGKVCSGAIVRHASRAIPGREGRDVVLDEIYRAIDEVVDAEVVGIGCGVPSVVDVESGVVYTVENIPSWQEVPLGDELRRRYGVPVRVNNDANAFALGELRYGRGRGRRNLVGLTLGTGLGAGVVIEGRLYDGANCGAGELGPIPYRDATVESYCSGAFFRRAAGIEGAEAYRRACAGDPEAVRLFAAFGHELGFAVLLTLYAYDPEIVVLGGSIARAYRWFEAGMRERLRECVYQRALERLEIVASDTENVALLGAAALYLDADGRRALA